MNAHRIGPIWIGVALVFVLGGIWWWVRDGRDGSGSQTLSGEAQEVIVTMHKDGFSPDKVTIKKGGRVTFVNEDSVDRWPASNIHPTHDIFPEFDPKTSIAPGQSWSFTFQKEGIWRYHDHNLPSLIGSVVVG